MDRLKTLRGYFINFIIFFLLSMLLIHIGLNTRYSNINSYGEIPGNVKIDLAQATSVNGRIFGKVTSSEGNELEGKYLKVDIFSKSNNLIGTKYLKLENLNLNEPKKFAVYFQAENVKNYTIDVMDSSEELEKEVFRVSELYKKIFINEDLKKWLIITLVVYALLS